MTRSANVIVPTLYCLDCRYVLDGLLVHRCPECGLWFYPDDPSTYATGPRRLTWTRIEPTLGRIGKVLVVLVCVGVAVVALIVFKPHINTRIDYVRSEIGRTGPIGAALGLYQAAMGRYPDSVEGLRALVITPDDADEEEKWRNGGGPFIHNREALVDPWGHEYQYVFPGKKNDDGMYDLWSYGPDEEDGTEDDINNW